jgi:hypothetical protein
MLSTGPAAPPAIYWYFSYILSSVTLLALHFTLPFSLTAVSPLSYRVASLCNAWSGSGRRNAPHTKPSHKVKQKAPIVCSVSQHWTCSIVCCGLLVCEHDPPGTPLLKLPHITHYPHVNSRPRVVVQMYSSLRASRSFTLTGNSLSRRRISRKPKSFSLKVKHKARRSHHPKIGGGDKSNKCCHCSLLCHQNHSRY